MSKASRCITAVLADLTEDDHKIVQESVADFKQRIAIIRRRIETGKEYSIVGASRRPAWCCDARGKAVGSGQPTIQQDDSTGIVERPKTRKPTRKTKIQ